MSTGKATKSLRDTLSLEISATERNLIDRAAKSAGKTPADFVLDAAYRAAEATLLDRTLKVEKPEVDAGIRKRLDQLAQPNERLRKTMRSKGPWQEG